MHVYEVRPRKDKRGIDLISDALPFGRLWYAEPNAISNAIDYAKHRSRSHDAVIRVYACIMDELVNLVVQKTGISQVDARKAVEVVVNALKSKLPGPVASHLDAFISGGLSGGVNTIADEAGEMLKGKLGGLFGGAKS